MRLDEAVRALRRPSGGGHIRRTDSCLLINFSAVESRVWNISDILANWEIIEPEPEKPREWILHIKPDDRAYVHQPDAANCIDYHPRVRVHDADQCEKLHHRCAHSCWKTHSTIDP